MRKYKDKDFAPINCCSTVRLTEKTYKESYSKCRIRKDLPKEEGFVYVLIPYERIAADAIIEIWGVDKKDAQKYKTAYIKATNETLRQKITGMPEKLEKSNISKEQKDKTKKIISIISAYQNKLKEKDITMPDPFNPIVAQSTPNAPKPERSALSESGEKAKSTLDKLLKEQPKSIEQNKKEDPAIADLSEIKPLNADETSKDESDIVPNITSEKSDIVPKEESENKSLKDSETIDILTKSNNEEKHYDVKSIESIDDDFFAAETKTFLEDDSKVTTKVPNDNVSTTNLDNKKGEDFYSQGSTFEKESAAVAESPVIRDEKTIPDFSLGLTIDDLMGETEKDIDVKDIQLVPDAEYDEVFSDDYFDDYLKEEKDEADETENADEIASANTNAIVTTAETTEEISDDDDDDIYKAMFGKSIE